MGKWAVVFEYVHVNPLDFALHQAGRAACSMSQLAPVTMLTRAARLAWLVVGLLSLLLGAIGIVLPLLPTTPFILVAALAFARSSKRLHDWLLDHNIFGPLIDNWYRYGAISRRAKVASVASMAALPAISLLLAASSFVIVVQLVVLGIAALFILSRPPPPPE